MKRSPTRTLVRTAANRGFKTARAVVILAVVLVATLGSGTANAGGGCGGWGKGGHGWKHYGHREEGGWSKRSCWQHDGDDYYADSYTKKHGVKFSHGYYYVDKDQKHFTRKWYDRWYKTDFHWDPHAYSWYYWCEGHGVYYPVRYIRTVGPDAEGPGPAADEKKEDDKKDDVKDGDSDDRNSESKPPEPVKTSSDEKKPASEGKESGSSTAKKKPLNIADGLK